MSVKIMSYDLETGGLSSTKNGIHQFAGRIYVDYVCKEEFKCDLRFDEDQEFDPKALEVGGKTIEQVMSSKFSQKQLYQALTTKMAKYCDKFNKADKLFLCGYNVHAFDNQFLRTLFERNGDNYFGSWFWSNSLDMMLTASSHLMMKRHLLPNFKLVTVAKELGFDVDESKAHDAFYDLTMHEWIFQKTTSIQLTPLQPS